MDLRDGHIRDILIAALVVGGILLILYAYTGNWPPPVVVESNSMMHVDADEYEQNFGDTRAEGVPYGRIGTIDPGDLVLVKEAGPSSEVSTYADGGGEHYGKQGEVVVYYRLGQRTSTPIIHRAMTYVDRSDAGGSTTYTVRWHPDWDASEARSCDLDAQGRGTCTFGDDGITIPELKLHNRHFQWSGFITQGDNVVGNQAPDQVLGIMNEPVRMEWVQGVARGELPWFGLIKLMLTSPAHKNAEVADHPYYWSIGKMTAPQDLWIMLVVGLAVVGLAPLGIDHGIHYWRRRQAEAEGSLGPASASPGDPSDGPPGGGSGPSEPDEAAEEPVEEGAEGTRISIDIE